MKYTIWRPSRRSLLCACYEFETWRRYGLAKHLFEWLPEFALTWRERESFSDGNAVSLLRRAAQVVYDPKKYSRREESGELLLYAMVRQIFGSEPAINKIF